MFWVFSSQCFRHELLPFSLVDLFKVYCSARQWFLSFFGTFYVVVQAILSFLSFKIACFSSKDSSLGLDVGLSFLTRMQPSREKTQAKTKSRHSKLFTVSPINLRGHIWATRNTCQSHVPILLLTRVWMSQCPRRMF